VPKTNSAKDQAEAEKHRAAVDKVLRKTVQLYGIGQTGVSGLDFDPKLPEHELAVTRGNPRTYISIAKDALDSPEKLASTILHESSHAQRNQELANRGIDRSKFGEGTETIWSAIIEAEAYQLEIDHARTLGTSRTFVKGAEAGKKGYVDELRVFAGEEWATLAEKGQFTKLREKFVQEHLKK
jgi:hypothetical protein